MYYMDCNAINLKIIKRQLKKPTFRSFKSIPSNGSQVKEEIIIEIRKHLKLNNTNTTDKNM